MAEALILGALVGDAVSKLSDAIIHVMKTTSQFKSKLTQLQETVTRIKSIVDEIQKHNQVLDRPNQETELFIAQLKSAQDLVLKCEHIKWNFYKRYRQSLKLDDLNASMLRFFQIDVQLQEARDVKEVLVVVKDVQNRMDRSSGGWASSVPLLKGNVIGFDDRVRDLKVEVFKDWDVDDSVVVVVSAAGGCGKTTLVTKFCHDPQFATISNTPNLKVVVRNLLQKNQGGQQPDFTSDEDAIQQWGSFLGEHKSEVLLVLDDVWDASIVKAFKFKSPGYKILVTSRSTFTQFRTYELHLLNHQDATNLFRYSAFSEGRNECNIPDDLVHKLVKCCKRHPLALSVIGGLLKGTHMAKWQFMLNKLSEGFGQKSVLDLDEDMRLRLATSLDVFKEGSEIKECYLDLGLFPEDQKIAATTLMDIWISLYKHDEKGSATLNNLFELSSKNLATLLPIRKDSLAIANYCDENAVMQHDMMRMLAINISSQEPLEHRKRLIINANDQNIRELPQTINARLFSISTDEAFSFKWNDIRAPKVEVLVLNFMSKIYSFPQFMQNMESLTVLVVTNYGYYFSDLHNFPAPQYLSSLTSIRLEHVSISSISASILGLVNLQRLSLIMCKVGNAFDETNLKIPNKFPSLLELDIDSCDDFVTFPTMLCNLVRLKKLSITNCHELSSLSEGFGNLTNLEVLRLVSCSNLKSLPETMSNLQKLSVVDLSHCLHVCNLPTHIDELGSLRTIHTRGCTGLHELPVSVKDLCPLEVICDEETSLLWSHLKGVKVQVIEEDRFSTFLKIVPREMHYN
ncbi:putative powdery mildew resistance protein, RPW8 [Helianthus annuus]|nr:putative powdery mildew resistance protein, RPW8 [Helianthus annuus]KAJ0644416.1 putative powdery mildew resistance protein, RPW8 [Helianthus annuus]KAJ0820746.1 putative powdery mildew resistance protein, RPW8 [Helianthus annuus]KAJ0835335.1 putative powdery mildew resistance protein, RPW8 [Helianthus annuus]